MRNSSREVTQLFLKEAVDNMKESMLRDAVDDVDMPRPGFSVQDIDDSYPEFRTPFNPVNLEERLLLERDKRRYILNDPRSGVAADYLRTYLQDFFA